MGYDNSNVLHCSFCGKSQHEVKKLIAGPTVFICDQCVIRCAIILIEEGCVKGWVHDGVPALDQPLRGTICSVTDDGRCGIVKLETPYLGFDKAIIGYSTKGRNALVNTNSSGGLCVNLPVLITRVEKGAEDLFFVLEVEAAPQA